MAFVTDIKGECNAGATPQMTLYPTRPARPNVKKLFMNAVPVIFPSAITDPIPAVTVATSRVAFFHGVIALTSIFSSTTGGAGGGAGMARGGGSKIFPL